MQVFKLTHGQLLSLLPESSFKNLDDAVQGCVQVMLRDQVADIPNVVGRFKEACSILKEPPLDVLKNIRRWALDCLQDKWMQKEPFSDDLSFRSSPGNASVERAGSFQTQTRNLTARQARGILANAFFANLHDTMKDQKDEWNVGGLDWSRLLLSYDRNGVGVARMKCHLLYFEAVMGDNSDMDRQIVFERIRYEPVDFFEGALQLRSPAVGHGTNLHNGVMEETTRPCSAFVNFANPNFGYGKFICSCTQEEILESCCPEMTVGMLWMGLLGDNEVVNVRNVRRFAKYTGYLNTFRCQGPVDRCTVQDILTMDACFDKHFTNQNMQRDLNKAYFAFRAHAVSSSQERPVVSTGKWGCGAFGGQAAHKFVQQALAASLAGVDLDFSVFGHSEGCDAVAKSLEKYKPSATAVAKALKIAKSKHSFVQDFEAALRQMSKQHQDSLHETAARSLQTEFKLPDV